jgi:hypothetical protein
MSERECSLVLGTQQPLLFEISQYLSHRTQAEVVVGTYHGRAELGSEDGRDGR